MATYRIILSKDNINPNNSTDHIKDTIVHTNSVHFNGLISGSRYYYSIQKQCSNNQVSQWSSSRFFNTSCHLIEHFPYKEDFERYLFDGYQGLPNYPPCWTKRESSILSTNFPAVIYEEYLANVSACLYFRSSANEFVQTILNELAVPVQEVKLTFMAWAPLSSDSLEVGVMTVNNRSSSFIPIDTIVATSVNNKEKIEIYFNKYQGVGRYIAFRSMT